jgi:hypothetical protein
MSNSLGCLSEFINATIVEMYTKETNAPLKLINHDHIPHDFKLEAQSKSTLFNFMCKGIKSRTKCEYKCW